MDINSISGTAFYGQTNTQMSNADVNSKTSSANVEQVVESERLIDPNSISLNEVNALIKSGSDQLLNVVPRISPNTISDIGTVAASELKVDLLHQVETMIAFKRSNGENTSYLEEVESTLSGLRNQPFPKRVSEFV